MSRTEEYNGSAWSSGGNMSQSKRDFEAVGILTSALCFGGDTGSLQNRTEKYNGTAWSTEGNSLATAKEQLCGAGTSSSALAWGGSDGSDSRTSEEWSEGLTARTLSNS